MKIPLSLIQQFLPIHLSPKEIGEKLTALGIEVDKIENETPSFQQVVVASVEETSPHPSADRLTIATVNDGTTLFQVVCGAPNCRKGIKTAFAKVGAQLTDAEGKKWVVKKAKLRGVESEGMLCAADELHLLGESQGILELPQELPLGGDLAALFCDPIFEISLTPNLGHCMSALGIARELSASTGVLLQIPSIALHETKGIHIREKVKVLIEDPSLCPKYCCRLIEDLHIPPTPFWIQQKLLGCGLRPVHCVVDILNLVMMEYGQPLHGFDYHKVEGKTIQVRTASKKEESFLGLDRIERKIPPSALLITNGEKPLALAGILGGLDSSVSNETTSVLVESALFDPLSIHRTSKALNLRSESSLRFAKGIDPAMTLLALHRAVSLIQELCRGKIIEGEVEVQKEKLPSKVLSLRIDFLNKLLGTQLGKSEVESIFHRLGFSSTPTSGPNLVLQIPSFRNDISQEVDLVEEAGRVYGYNNIERRNPKIETSALSHSPLYLLEKHLRKKLCGEELQELLNCDLIGPELSKLTLELSYPKGSILPLLYSKSAEYSLLRPSLLPGLLQSLKHNLDRKNDSLFGFEIGRIYWNQKDEPVEQPVVGILFSGENRPHHWERKPHKADFFDLKGTIENLFLSLRIPSYEFLPSSHPTFHPGRQATLMCQEKELGICGEIHPKILWDYGIKERVFFAEINSSLLLALPKQKVQYEEISPFPSSERDWTIPFPDSFPLSSLFQAIDTATPSILEEVQLWDLYKNPLAPGEKNITLHFIYRSKTKTVSFEEVEQAHGQLIQQVNQKLQSFGGTP